MDQVSNDYWWLGFFLFIVFCFFGVRATKFWGKGGPWAELWSRRIAFLSILLFNVLPLLIEALTFLWFTKIVRSLCCSLTLQDPPIMQLTSLQQNIILWPPLKHVYCVLSIHENWGGGSMYINTLQGCSFSLLMRHFKMHIYIVKVSIHLPEKKSCIEARSCQLSGSDCKSGKAEVFFISSRLCSLPPYLPWLY